MVDLNTTIALLAPVSNTITSVVKTISILIGGLFGLYLAYYIIRIVFARSLFKTVREIKNYLKDIDVRMKNIEEDIDDYKKLKPHIKKHLIKKKRKK